MGLFDFFRRRRRQPKRRKKIISRDRRDIGLVQKDLQTVKITIDQHSRELADHKLLLDSHTAKITSLEQVISLAKPEPPPAERTVFNQPATTKPATERSSREHNMESFSQQEKRILAVLFQNPDMALSYVDIAKTLGKSPNTIKNQMHQIGLKADLFDKTIGDEQRNRFKLKDGLRIEKYLNVV